ncbi:MAG: YfiR family protein [Bacteroidota bacterium]
MSFLISLLLVGQAMVSDVKETTTVDAKRQAMYLYNLVRYIDWKKETTVIGVMGESKVIPELSKIVNQDSKVEVKQIANIDMTHTCDVIFLPDVSNGQFYQVQQKVGSSSILVVVDQKHLVVRGAEMGFYEENQKLKVGVNKQAIQEAGIKISNSFMTKVSAL